MDNQEALDLIIEIQEKGFSEVNDSVNTLNTTLSALKGALNSLSLADSQAMEAGAEMIAEGERHLKSATEQVQGLIRSFREVETGATTFSGVAQALKTVKDNLDHATLGTDKFQESARQMFQVWEDKTRLLQALDQERFDYLSAKMEKTIPEMKELATLYERMAQASGNSTDATLYRFEGQKLQLQAREETPRFRLDDVAIKEQTDEIQRRIRLLERAGLNIKASVNVSEIDELMARIKTGDIELKVKDTTALTHLQKIKDTKEEIAGKLLDLRVDTKGVQAAEGSLGHLYEQYQQAEAKFRNSKIDSTGFMEAQKDMDRLAQEIARAEQGMKGFNNTLYQSKSVAGSAANVLLQANYAVRDSAYFFRNGQVDLAFGLMAIGNNINPIIDGLINLKMRSQDLGGTWAVLKSALAGPSGLMMAFSVAVTALQAFTFMAVDAKSKANHLAVGLDELTAAYDGDTKAVERLKSEVAGLSFDKGVGEFHKLSLALSDINSKLNEGGTLLQIWQGLTFKPLTDYFGLGNSLTDEIQNNLPWPFNQMAGKDKDLLDKQRVTEQAMAKLRRSAGELRDVFQASDPMKLLKGRSPNELKNYLDQIGTIMGDWSKDIKNKSFLGQDSEGRDSLYGVALGTLNRQNVIKIQNAIRKMISEDQPHVPKPGKKDNDAWWDFYKKQMLEDPDIITNEISKQFSEIRKKYASLRLDHENKLKDVTKKPTTEAKDLLKHFDTNELLEATAFIEREMKKVSDIDTYLGTRTANSYENQRAQLKHRYEENKLELENMKTFLLGTMQDAKVSKEIKDGLSKWEVTVEGKLKDMSDAYTKGLSDIDSKQRQAGDTFLQRFESNLTTLSQRSVDVMEARRLQIRKTAEGLRRELDEAVTKGEMTPTDATISRRRIDEEERLGLNEVDKDKRRYMQQQYNELLQENMLLKTLDSSARQLGNSLVDAFTGAKVSVESLGKQLLATILQLVIMEGITSLLASAFGLGTGAAVALSSSPATKGLSGLAGASGAGQSLKKSARDISEGYTGTQTLNVQLTGGIKTTKNSFLFELERAQKQYDRLN